jgi:glycosyltransferase involved in cell wall biosynthesis
LKIAYITAGAAGMYCGSCMHDNTLAAALKGMGHDVALIPTYTPVRTDETDVSIHRVFYGAVNVYLEQRSSFFRHLPRPIHWLLDRPGLLNWASGHGVTPDPEVLGELTLSVLRGEEGNQKRELDELVAWLRDSYEPDIVHITNSMFLGLAGPIRRELGVPVVCSVQGEDLFVDLLIEPYKTRVRRELRAHARDVDAVIATGSYYAEFMADYLDLPLERVRIVHLGINLEGHGAAPARMRQENDARPFVIGYLARICPEKGLHILAEAFRKLAGEVGNDAVALRVAGYLGKRDEQYLHGIQEEIEDWGLSDAFEYVGEVNRAEKIEFLGGLDVLSVPTPYQDPKGLFIFEALANQVPVVQPGHGAFPELIEMTGGGLLAVPESPSDLADQIRILMDNEHLRQELGQRGRVAVERLFSDTSMAENTLNVYREWSS